MLRLRTGFGHRRSSDILSFHCLGLIGSSWCLVLTYAPPSASASDMTLVARPCLYFSMTAPSPAPAEQRRSDQAHSAPDSHKLGPSGPWVVVGYLNQAGSSPLRNTCLTDVQECISSHSIDALDSPAQSLIN